MDTTPTNKSIDSNVNKDVKSVDVETKGTSKNLLSNDGKFKDSKLESDYEKYLARKGKIDKTPRERLEWKKQEIIG